ncbi:hypothetical protein ACFX2A_025501 [Malus domestica]
MDGEREPEVWSSWLIILAGQKERSCRGGRGRGRVGDVAAARCCLLCSLHGRMPIARVAVCCKGGCLATLRCTLTVHCISPALFCVSFSVEVSALFIFCTLSS